MEEFEAFDTMAVHAGEEADAETGALRQPLHMSTTFKLPGFGVKLFEALLMENANTVCVYTLGQPYAALAGKTAGETGRRGGVRGDGKRDGGGGFFDVHAAEQRRPYRGERSVLRRIAGTNGAASATLRGRGEPGGHL